MRLVTWKEKRDYKALGKKHSKILKLVASGGGGVIGTTISASIT